MSSCSPPALLKIRGIFQRTGCKERSYVIHQDPGHVVIDGMMYPKITKWQRWVQQQPWPCQIGWHYLLPAGRTPNSGAQLCVCGRCGYSTWWTGNIWKLQVNFGYWTQAHREIPPWRREKSPKYIPRWIMAASKASMVQEIQRTGGSAPGIKTDSRGSVQHRGRKIS